MRVRFTAIALALLAAANANGQAADRAAARIDSALRAVEAKGFSGVVRVDRGGSTMLARGYGLANRETQTPFGPKTVIQIGSNTKDFTVVALLQLQERGRLNIHDSLAKFFPNAPTDKRNITLWQLVLHTAGFPIGLGGDFEPLDRQAFLDAAFARPLAFTPGTREQYSNTGYSLLAAVIEKVSGVAYDEFIRANILEPLGLKNTGLLLPGFDPKRLAHGYRSGKDQGTMLAKPHAADGPYWNLRGNGGMLSTVGDMHAFYTALFETDRLLKPATRKLRFNPDEPIGLAGSDLVNYFVYERLPGRHIEIIIASNTPDVPPRVIRDAIGSVLGLPSDNDGPPAAAGPRANAKAPAPAVAALINDLVKAINGANAAALTTFVGDNFVIAAGTPTAAQRAARFVGMHGNLGELKVVGLDQISDDTVEASLMTANEGAATLKFTITPGSKPRVVGLQISVGG
jgi:CubicO group peptidase (beta-lactamase class C family)